MQYKSHSSLELQQHAAEFVRTLSPRPAATIVALSGELGAGKTTFAQGIARALGIEENVTSPTFVIEKVYELEQEKWSRLVHIDAYRLKSAHELDVLGWKELIEEPGNLIVLEWPERVEPLIPPDAVRIRFDIAGDGRTITVNGNEEGEKN